MVMAGSHVFEAMVEDSTNILKLLSGVLIEDKPNALFQLSRDGIRVVVSKNKVIQGTVEIKKDCFNDYKFQPLDKLELTLDLRHFLKCLGVLGNAAGHGDYSSFGESRFQSARPSLGSDIKSLRMLLETVDSPLELVVDEDSESDGQIHCTVATQHGEAVAFAPQINEEHARAGITLKSELMMELWEDLDHSSERVWIKMSNGISCLSLMTKSEIAEVELIVREKDDGVEKFKCHDKEDITLCFRVGMLKMIMTSLNLSQKVHIMFFVSGEMALMAIDLSVLDDATGEPLQSVQYICSAVTEEENEEFNIAARFNRSMNVNL